MAKAYFVECRTGCSCCSSDNHWRGPYSSREAAEKRVEFFKSVPIVSSQYSRQGVYRIEEYDAESLADGRFIANECVFGGFRDDGADEELYTKWNSF